MAKYLDENGLSTLIDLIKAKDSELEESASAAGGQAELAASSAQAAKASVDALTARVDTLEKAKHDAPTSISAAEVTAAWNKV